MDTHSIAPPVPVTYVPVVKREGEYEILYETVGKSTFVHVNVDHWSMSIKRRFQEDIETAAALHGGPFLVLCPLTNTKLRKFCSQFGFVHGLYLTLPTGEPNEILVKRVE